MTKNSDSLVVNILKGFMAEMSRFGPKPRREKWNTVVRLLAQGLTNQEIATESGITKRMVGLYIGRLMQENKLYGPGDERRLMVLATQGKLLRK